MRQPDLPAEGGCRCGAVRFRVTLPPILTTACHCKGCQRMTGGPYSLSAAFPDAGFELIKGETVPGGIDHDFGHRHCAHCKTWLFTKPEMMAGFINIRATMLDDASWYAPYLETCASEGLPFAQTGATISYPDMPPMEVFPGAIADYAKACEAG